MMINNKQQTNKQSNSPIILCDFTDDITIEKEQYLQNKVAKKKGEQK